MFRTTNIYIGLKKHGILKYEYEVGPVILSEQGELLTRKLFILKIVVMLN